MKMSFLGSGIFWGSVLILIGISIIIKMIFKIEIPVFRILMALFFFWIGIRLISGGWGGMQGLGKTIVEGRETTVIFNSSEIDLSKWNPAPADDLRKFNVVFANGEIDLSRLNLNGQNVKIEVNAIFGHAVIKTSENVPLKVEGNAAFGAVTLPDGVNAAGFGNAWYDSKNLDSAKPSARMKANAVFGAVEFK